VFLFSCRAGLGGAQAQGHSDSGLSATQQPTIIYYVIGIGSIYTVYKYIPLFVIAVSTN